MDEGGAIEDLRQRLEEVTARLAAVEDERAVCAAIAAYSVTIDTDDLEGWLDCFTEDGRFSWRPTAFDHDPRIAPGTDGPTLDVKGRDELESWARSGDRWLTGLLPMGRENHAIQPPQIVSLEGDRAEAETWYVIVRSEDGRTCIRSTGRYFDRLVRCSDGRWRIAERRTEGILPSPPQALADGRSSR